MQKCGDNPPVQLRPKLTSVAYIGKAVGKICGIVGAWGPINARMPPPLRFCGELTMELFEANFCIEIGWGQDDRLKRKRHRRKRLMIRPSLKPLTKGEGGITGSRNILTGKPDSHKESEGKRRTRQGIQWNPMICRRQTLPRFKLQTVSSPASPLFTPVRSGPHQPAAVLCQQQQHHQPRCNPFLGILDVNYEAEIQ